MSMSLSPVKLLKARCGAICAAICFFSLSLMPVASSLGARPTDAWFYVHNDKAEDIKGLLAAGWDPNARYQGQPALMQAVRDGAWRVFDVLAADRRTDVNATNPSNETPLMYLAVQGQTARAQALIARGAQVNRLGWTPLHYAASTGHVDTARLLLSHQAIVNAPGVDGTTPLMMAGRSGSREMAQLLLDAGADPSMRNLQGLDAAAWAQSAKYEQLAELLTVAADNRQRRRGSPLTNTGGAPTAPNPPQAVRGSAPASLPEPVPEPAPTDAAPAAGERNLSGVSGVGLDSYDKPANP
jgi:ankyrin repeat protein